MSYVYNFYTGKIIYMFFFLLISFVYLDKLYIYRKNYIYNFIVLFIASSCTIVVTSSIPEVGQETGWHTDHWWDLADRVSAWRKKQLRELGRKY